jgi:ParB/RepB/Spo0J family partition protein
VGKNQLPAEKTNMAKNLKGKLKRGLRVITTVDIKIEDLIIENRFRDLTDEDVEMLVESLEELGQPRTITVRKHLDKPEKYRVIAGATLVKAAEKLGWPSVRADVLKCSDAEARRWEIDENLNRHRLTAIEEADHIAERMRTFDNEEAESGQKGGKPKQGRPQGTIAKAAGKLRLKGKTQKARRKQIERGLKIASITPEAKVAAKEAGLHDNRSALLEIADQDTTEEQLAKVQKLARGKTSSKAKKRNPWLGNWKTKKTKQSASKASLSPKDKKGLAKLLKLWNAAAKLKGGFGDASQAVRDRFIERILESASSKEDDTETELKPQQDDQEMDGNDNNNDDLNAANDNDDDNDNDDEDNEQSNDSDWV